MSVEDVQPSCGGEVLNNILKKFISGDEKVIEKVPPLIYQSWKRCRDLSLNHERIVQRDILQKPELKELLDMNEPLLLTARPILQYIFSFIRSKSYVLVLSNNEGYIIETIGDPGIIHKARKQIFLTVGANWQESAKGTNGIGTTLLEKTPVAVPGWTHYAMPVSFLDCWAAPIRRANGDLAGVLNISGEAGVKHEHMMEITTAGAAMIEHSLQMAELRDKYNQFRQDLDSVGKLISSNVVNIRAGLTRGASGGLKNGPGISNGDLIGKNIDEVFANGHGIFSAGTDCETITMATGEKWQGRSGKIRAVFDMAMRAAKGDSTVLIQGESGTGKEIIARCIHSGSLRCHKPFVTLNCAAIPDSLVESELFGYADGAFTGAKKGGQPGKFELAHGGTIFLDEIGDMPIGIQATLLRVLQQKEIYRIGDGTRRELNVRIIAATNQDLKQLVNQGKFRLDLYYRLKVIQIEIPPLRERLEDILDLAPHFVGKFCAKYGRPVLDISPEAYNCLLGYTWPGNVRQLENCIEGMIALSDGANLLTLDDIPAEYKTNTEDLSSGLPGVLSQQTANLERATILQVLRESDGIIAVAARKLGIGRTTLYRKMDKLSIPY